MIARPVTTLVHDSGSPIPPGATAQIVVRPQCDSLRPVRLYVEPGIAGDFDLLDVLIGCRSQFPCSQTLPCSYFAEQTNDALGALMCAERIGVCMDFVVYVTNKSKEPRRFVGTWTCEMRESPAEAEARALRDELEAAAHANAMQIKALGDQIWRDHQRYQAELGVYAERISEETKAKDGWRARYENILAESSRAQAEISDLHGHIARLVDENHALRNPIPLLPTPELERLRSEDGPSATSAAPERKSPIERWQRGAPCMWDPEPGAE